MDSFLNTASRNFTKLTSSVQKVSTTAIENAQTIGNTVGETALGISDQFGYLCFNTNKKY